MIILKKWDKKLTSMKNSLLNYIISFVAVLISVSLGILTGIDEVRNWIILSFIIHWLLFIPAYVFKTEKFYDLTGTISYISIVLYVLLSSTDGIINLGNMIVSSLIIIWTLRLGTFLFVRIKKAYVLMKNINKDKNLKIKMKNIKKLINHN